MYVGVEPDKTPVQVEGGLEALLPLVSLSTLGTWAGVLVKPKVDRGA